jgi:ankyrin repeat protein
MNLVVFHNTNLTRFLLAQLHIKSLVGKRSPKALRNALAKLPTGIEAYSQAYDDAMERIESQVDDQTDLAKQVLSWITCARRPLTTLELQHALAVEHASSDIDEDNMPEIQDMLSVCAGLVTVDDESKVIRLVHYTTQQYFEQNQTKWFSNTEANITAVCLTYLSFSAFWTGPCQTRTEYQKRLYSYPFYDYAARNWGHHARGENPRSQQEIPNQTVIDFLETESKLHASSQVILANRQIFFRPHFNRHFPMYTTALHVAAYFGLEAALDALLKGKYPPDTQDLNGQTPLSWAAEIGNFVFVKRFLETGEVDVDSREPGHGRTPLIFAAGNGHLAIVELLVSHGADVELADSELDSTPILWAAWRGYKDVVMFLLDQGADIEARNFFDSSALSLAVKSGHSGVVKLLLQRGANTDLVDKHDQSPLSHAAEEGYENIVEMLLTIDNIDIEARDAHGQTPLLYAISANSIAIVKRLLEAGANINSKDHMRVTPLALAVEEGHEAIVELLLSTKDCDAYRSDPKAGTLVSLARQQGHETIVQLLLDFESRMVVDEMSTDTVTQTFANVLPEDKIMQNPSSDHSTTLTYQQLLSLEMKRIIKSPTAKKLVSRLTRNLNQRRYFVFWDNSGLRQFREEARSFFDAIGLILDPKLGLIAGNIEVVFASNPIVAHENFEFYKLLEIVREHSRMQSTDTSEHSLSNFIREIILPRLPPENATSNGMELFNGLPLSVFILTGGIWSTPADVPGFEYEIKNLLQNIRHRSLDQTQVMIQFIRFGDNKDTIGYLNHLKDIGRLEDW